jgi:hypothetical protein
MLEGRKLPTEALDAVVPSGPLFRNLIRVFLLGLCVLAGYLIAGWWSGKHDMIPLVQICARVDYINGLQEALQEQQAASEDVREEFNVLVEECRAALRNRAEERD